MHTHTQSPFACTCVRCYYLTNVLGSLPQLLLSFVWNLRLYPPLSRRLSLSLALASAGSVLLLLPLLLFSELIYSWPIYEHSDFRQHLHLPATSNIRHPSRSRSGWEQELLGLWLQEQQPRQGRKGKTSSSGRELCLRPASFGLRAPRSLSQFRVSLLSLNNLKHLGIQYVEMIMRRNCFLTRSPGVASPPGLAASKDVWAGLIILILGQAGFGWVASTVAFGRLVYWRKSCVAICGNVLITKYLCLRCLGR